MSRQDGVKEKRAEFTLARLHPLGAALSPAAAPPAAAAPSSPAPVRRAAAPAPQPVPQAAAAPPQPAWNTSPLVPDLPDDDDIPF